MRRGEGTPPYGFAQRIQAVIFQNQTQEIQFILAELTFGGTAKETEGKKHRVPIPLIYGDRHSFASTATAMCQRRLAVFYCIRSG